MANNHRTGSPKNKKWIQPPRPSLNYLSDVSPQFEASDALQRVKSRQIPNIKQSDMLLLQRSMGNNALGRLIQQYNSPEGRRKAREEKRTIQTNEMPPAKKYSAVRNKLPARQYACQIHLP